MFRKPLLELFPGLLTDQCHDGITLVLFEFVRQDASCICHLSLMRKERLTAVIRRSDGRSGERRPLPSRNMPLRRDIVELAADSPDVLNTS